MNFYGLFLVSLLLHGALVHGENWTLDTTTSAAVICGVGADRTTGIGGAAGSSMNQIGAVMEISTDGNTFQKVKCGGSMLMLDGEIIYCNIFSCVCNSSNSWLITSY